MNNRILFNTYMLCLIIPFMVSILTGCQQKPVIQEYQEAFTDSQERKSSTMDDPHAFLKMMPNDEIHSNLKLGDPAIDSQLMKSVASTPLSWTTPKQWQEKKGSGMRLVTFVSNDTAMPIETTIVSLAGGAGGRVANVARWLQQLQLPVDSDEEIERFIKQQEVMKSPSGLSVIVLDFTLKQKNADNQVPSMIAAIVEGNTSQIFIKMTGSKQSVLKNMAPFRELLNSLRIPTDNEL